MNDSAWLTHSYGNLSPEEATALDHAAAACGFGVERLMEFAGWQVARCAWLHLGGRPGSVFVMAGRGNNGGDALAAARHLHDWGCTVRVALLTAGSGVSALAAAQLTDLGLCTGLEVTEIVDEAHLTGQGNRAQIADLVIDGILGTGLHGSATGLAGAAIQLLSGARVLSVDVPSGLDAASGEQADPCVHAVATCTLAAMKTGLWTASGAAAAGVLWVADIGFPASAWAACGLQAPASVLGGDIAKVGVDVPDTCPI